MEVLKTDVDSGSPTSHQKCSDSPQTITEESSERVEISPSMERAETNSFPNENVVPWSIDNNWGLSQEELFDMASIFLKEKDGKAFHPTYEEKLRLVALHKQSSQGPYNPDTCPEVGFFDVLGNDRRKEWESLGKMTKEDAVAEFIKLMNICCPLFCPYVTSHKIEKEEQERKRREEGERLRLEREEMERRQQEEEQRGREEQIRQQREEKRRQEDEERLRIEQQKQQIVAALNAQTSVQFQQYAAQQCPDDPEQQKLLIQQLQEQHYQQYIQQAYKLQLSQQQANLWKQEAESTVPPPGNREQSETCKAPDSERVNDHLDTNSPPQVDLHTGPPAEISAPSMWTRPHIKDFKEKIQDDPDSIITVGRGEMVTVRVPTNEDGSYMFWEFATDHYDVGFGLYFEWADIPVGPSSSVTATTEPSDEDADKGEPQEETLKDTPTPFVEEVVPIYRRDSHEEVYSGSHQYPGQGTYLLKFDNSYSLWRSKVVYYRVYYTG
ncbi:Golgi resident protein GCP60 isoform X2 [Clupea harengus]|uniref:Golgi resident protein GCP60 n=1 Tax=Clupea harengus TaxID=7950 RepID=A0A6P3W859_CLUHA|nr:Golgi resident protein GCP60 isoform X2 [Clupea harengus]